MELVEMIESANEKKLEIYNSVSKFLNEQKLKFLPKIYFVCSFKVGSYEERAKMNLINFNEHYIEINLGPDIEIFQYDYVENRINKPIEFFFSLTRRGSVFPDFNKILLDCKNIYSNNSLNIETFRVKGLRKLLEEAHVYKLNIMYHDYQSIIKGFEDEFFISEEEFNEYKKDTVGNYVAEKTIKYLSQ